MNLTQRLSVSAPRIDETTGCRKGAVLRPLLLSASIVLAFAAAPAGAVDEHHPDAAGSRPPAGATALAQVGPTVEKMQENVRQMQSQLERVAAAKTDGSTPDFAWAVREAAEILVQLFHPMMPHLAEECWATLGHTTLIATAAWPKVESALLVEDSMTLPVQINGKKRADVTVARNATNADIEAAVLALEPVRQALQGKPPRKFIVVPGRIVNVVA